MYNVNYSEYEKSLCSIELRALFNRQFDEKIFFSDVKVDPNWSAFIKNRFRIIHQVAEYDELLSYLEGYQDLKADFTVKYLKLVSGDPNGANRNSLCKEAIVRLSKNASLENKKDRNQNDKNPNYENPTIVYGITQFEGVWYFGELVKNQSLWRKHNNRPYTYSNSLKINMAKVLINIAGQGDLSKRIIDPCCGAGTVLLEGCFAGYSIVGSDISWKTAKNARENLEFFGYNTKALKQDIQKITDHYDSSIVDLPYGLYSSTSYEDQKMILENAKRISDRVIIISSEDISGMLEEIQLKLIDSCNFLKSVNRKFTRYIWVCQS